MEALFILVVGNPDDPHMEAVGLALQHRNLTAAYVCPPYFGRQYAISFEYPRDESVSLRIKGDGRTYNARDCAGVWWRLKPSMTATAVDPSDHYSFSFIEREWAHALEPIWDLTNAIPWINPRTKDRSARYKPYQLAKAQQLGVRIPDSLITNDPHEAAAFVGEHARERCIYKPLTSFANPVTSQLLFTTPVTVETIERLSENLAVAPGIFQEEIAKAYELRVTAVGRQLFAVAIDSQERIDTRLDWRIDQINVKQTLVDLSRHHRDIVEKLHDAFGLVYAAYDFVVTPSNDLVFLEVNPSGQWLWIEQKLGAPISDAIAEYFLAGIS